MADESIVPEEESTALDISSKALDLLKGTGAYSRYPSGDSKAKITRATLWNRWKKIFIKKKISFKGADLTSANLTGFDLSDFDFSGANFTDANLTETILNDTIFTGAILEGVKFTRATLTNIVFSRNNLSFCNFCDTVCNNVKFLNCVITCANMPGFHRIADFGWAVLNKCEFRGVTFIGTSPISFTKAQITESTFYNVKFMHKNNFVIEVVFTSDLYNDPCIISNCTFNQVVFKPTFNSSKLTGVTFVKCGLDGMNANSASFSKCTFSMSSAKSSYFGATILNNVTFDNVGLENARFIKATLDDCRFIRCDVRDVNFKDAKLFASFQNVDNLKINQLEQAKEVAPLINWTIARYQRKIESNPYLKSEDNVLNT